MIAWDTETGLIQPGNLTPPLVCLQLAGDGAEPPAEVLKGAIFRRVDDGWMSVHDYDGAEGALAWALASGEAIATHNGPYDVAVVLNEYPGLADALLDRLEEDGWHDTMVNELLFSVASVGEIQNLKGHYTLGGLVERYLDERVIGKDGEDIWRLRYMELALVPLCDWPTEAVDYAILDPDYTLRVAKAQDVQVDLGPQVRAAVALHLCATVGPRVNPERAAAFEATAKAEVEKAAEIGREAGILRTEIKKDLERLRADITEAYGGEPPRNTKGLIKTSAKALRESTGVGETADALRAWVKLGLDKKPEGVALGLTRGWLLEKEVATASVLKELCLKAYEARGEHPGYTETLQVSTDKDTLLASKDTQLVGYANGSVYRTALSRYAPQLWLGTEHDMTSRPRPLKATGRCAWGDPNMHNPPRKGGFREAFEPRPGYVYGMCDWRAAELRSWAQICIWLFGRSEMAEAFREGMDPHTMLASTLRGCSYEEAVALRKAGDLPERKMAKAGNFGFLGGMGSETFITYCEPLGLTLTPERSAEIREAFFETWPMARRYFAWVNDEVLRGRRGLGEQFISGRLRARLGYCDACNTFFQGLTADYAKAALWNVWREALTGREWEHRDRPSPLKGVRPWLLLHDEIIVEGPEETASAWGDRLRDVMVEVASIYTPDVPQACDVALSRVWSKSAEEVRDVSGRLVLWEPPREALEE